MSEKRRNEPVGTLDDGLRAALGRHKAAVTNLGAVLDEYLEEYDRIGAILSTAEAAVTSAYYDVSALEKAIRNTGLVVITLDDSRRTVIGKDGHLESHRMLKYHEDARKRRGDSDDG